MAAEKTKVQILKGLSFFNLIPDLKKLFTSNVTPFGTTTNLPSTPATLADLAAARAAIEALKTATETRLDNLESKVNEVING